MTTLNVFAQSFVSRRASEVDNNMCAASLKMLDKAALIVSQKKVADFLKKSNVRSDIAQDSRIANKMICVKALNRAINILNFAMNASAAKLNECEDACVRTMLLHAKHSEAFDIADFDTALDATVTVADERKHLFYKRKSHFAAINRHSQMTMRALSALNCVAYDANARKYRMNDNAITQALRERLAA